MAVLYYVGFSIFFDTPFEYQMKHSTDRLRNEYEALAQRYDSLTTVLGNLADRDRSVFRILFESEPYDLNAESQARQSSTYEKIVGRSTRQLKRELREGVIEMEQRLGKLNDSYLALQALIDLRDTALEVIDAETPKLPRIETVRLRQDLPSVVVAHRLYGDRWYTESLDQELVTRNAVRRPLMMPADVELEAVIHDD